LFDLERRLLIERANGSDKVLDCRFVKALSESEHIFYYYSVQHVLQKLKVSKHKIVKNSDK
jgi:hypothetical protein